MEKSNHEESIWWRLVVQYGTTLWIRALSFFTLIVFAKCLAKPDVGAMILALTIIELVAVLSDAGCGGLLTVRLAAGKKTWRQPWHAGLMTRLIGACLALLLSGGLWFWYGMSAGLLTVILVSGLFPFVWTQNVRAYWNGRRQLLRLQRASAWGYTLGHLSAITLAWTGAAPTWIALALAASFWLEAAFLFYLCPPEKDPYYKKLSETKSPPARTNYFATLKLALPFGLFAITWLSYLRVDIFLVEIFAPSTLAEYGLSLKFYNATMMMLQSAGMIFLSDSTRIRGWLRRLRQYAPHLCLGGSLIGIPLLLWAPVALVAILPTSYQFAEATSRTLLVAAFLHGGGMVLAHLALGEQHQTSGRIWAIYALGTMGLTLLTCGEYYYCGTVFAAGNRLLFDGILFLIILRLYLVSGRSRGQEHLPR